MGTPVKNIRGVTAEVAAKLKERNIDNTDELLAAGRTGAQRRELAAAVGVKENDIMEMVQRADLSRLKGVGDSLANLLEESGVDSTQELARRRADNLYAKLNEVNAARKISQAEFSEADVQGWIDEAKTLPDLIDR
jgi:predicted flap endonuclease-1-like 5' DNA nuclease